ncbi:MAG: hypothetical protein ACKVOU_14520 [Cytophagales bacterium]
MLTVLEATFALVTNKQIGLQVKTPAKAKASFGFCYSLFLEIESKIGCESLAKL